MNDTTYKRVIGFLLFLCSIGLWFAVLSIALVMHWSTGSLAFATGLTGAVVGGALVHFIYQVVIW